MTPEPALVVKLGGSVVTRKSGLMDADMEAIARLTLEVKEASVDRLVLVHGGGSFGHPLAGKYRLRQGFVDDGQLMGFALTHMAMTKLNTLVVERMTGEGLPAVSVRPSAFIMTESGRIGVIDLKPLRGLLDLGFLPVLCGDVVSDGRLGFTVVSGDQICSMLASGLGSKRIVLGVDVDGLYTADPKVDESARLVASATPAQLRSLLEGMRQREGRDVTGGMVGKMREVLPFVESGGVVFIVNAACPGRLGKALKSEEFYGTIIHPS